MTHRNPYYDIKTVHRFEGREFHEFKEMGDCVKYVNDAHFQVSKSGRFEGMHFERWYEVEEQTRKCWAQGISTMDQYKAELRDRCEQKLKTLKSRKRKAEFNDEGNGEFDFERYFQGEHAFRDAKREETTGPGDITIVIDTTTPWFHDSMDVLWRGACGIALAELLEDKGYRCEIWVCNGSRLYMGNDTPVMVGCNLKRTSDPMDSSTLINTVSGWFYRSAIFALVRTIAEDENQTTDWGLGSAYVPTIKDLKTVLGEDEHPIYVAGVYSKNEALEVVMAEVDRLATKADDDANEANGK